MQAAKSWKYDRYIAAPLYSLVDLGRSLAGSKRGLKLPLRKSLYHLSVNAQVQPTLTRLMRSFARLRPGLPAQLGTKKFWNRVDVFESF